MNRCPDCGAPAEPGQLVCTSCGRRLALRAQGGPGPPRSVLALLLAVVVIGAGASGFALSELTSGDDEPSPGGAATATPPAPSARDGEPQAPSRARSTETAPAPRTETEATKERSPAARRTPLLDWPRGLSAYTVVLVTSSDGPAARRVARGAARSGLEAGLLRSDDYNLGTGLWIVFAGRFDSRRSAARQAVNLSDSYPGAYPQLVRPVG